LLEKDCICYEDYPFTYRHYRRRTEKWVKGTLEFLFKEYPDFFLSKNISWFEKLDVFVSGLSLALGFPFLLFLLVGGVVLPLFFTGFKSNVPVFIPAIPQGKTAVSMLTGLRYNAYWTMDFYLIMLVTIFYPLIPVFIDLVKKPVQMFRYMFVSTYLFLSTLVWISYVSLSYILTREIDFLVTSHEGVLRRNSLWAKINSINIKHKIILIAECFFAAVFAIIVAASNNLWLLSVAIALVLSPFMFMFDCESRLMRRLISIPFVISLFILLLISKSIVR
jgi:hypothetical protein